jgi:RHS repeat-associated protein
LPGWRVPIGAALAALLVAAPAEAGTKPRLELSGPATVTAGSAVKYRLKLTNGSKPLRASRLVLVLSADKRLDKRDASLAKALRIKRLARRKTLTHTYRVTIRRPGRARLLACLKRSRPVCGSLAITVRAKAAPAPAPAPLPAPAPAAVATPAPQPAPTDAIPPPAPGPADPPAADPSARAPDLPAYGATAVYDATSFLYTGADPIQRDVAPGTIQPRRVAVLRGRVTGEDGLGLGGVRVSVLGHAEDGHTDTRADGGYDIAVNGGGTVTLEFERAGFVPAQRSVPAPWEDYADVDPLTLIPYDQRSTLIDPGSGNAFEVARGTTHTDADGTRTQTLLFPHGVQATMTVDGVASPVTAPFRVRATEFTVGAGGVQRMAAQLPPSTGYTYMTELSIDQAVAAGASRVTFSAPVISYVDDFIGLPAGQLVPNGAYDRDDGRWVGAGDGVVLKVVSITDGRADLDLAGDGAAHPELYARFGITDAERATLAGLYPPGARLWRMVLGHFTIWDHNLPYGPSSDAVAPNGGPPAGGCTSLLQLCMGPCDKGSVIHCTTQELGESEPVDGTPFRLTYLSGAMPGAVATHRTITIPLCSELPPPDSRFRAVQVEIQLAGRTIAKEFPAADVTPGERYTYVWDGRDAYGRPVVGGVSAHIRVGFTYGAVYQLAPGTLPGVPAVPGGELPSSSWAMFSGFAVDAQRSDLTYTVWADSDVGLLAPAPGPIDGWGLSVLDSYSPQSHTLMTGDGQTGAVTPAVLDVLDGVAGIGAAGFTGDGGPAGSAALDAPRGIAAAPDGAIVVADSDNNRIRRVSAAGTITTIAGTGVYGFGGDGGPATAGRLSQPRDVAVAADGSVYVADTGANRIRRISPSGTITTVAGGGAPADGLGDGGAATSARLSAPMGVAVAPDGAVYVADTGHDRVRMVGTHGAITTVAGTGAPGFSGDGGPAVAARLRAPRGVAVDREGDVLIADTDNDRVRRVAPDGIIDTLAGGGAAAVGLGDGGAAVAARLSRPEKVAAAPDGAVLVADTGDSRVREVGSDGIVSTVAGGGTALAADGVSAAAAQLDYHGIQTGPEGVAVQADGRIAFSQVGGYQPNGQRVWRIASPGPGFGTGTIPVPSRGGDAIDEFAPSGQLLRVHEALTGATLYSFAYDAAGRLTRVDDPASLRATAPSAPLLTIQRDAAGDATALVARGGQTTALGHDGSGYLSSLTAPGGLETTFAYGTGGLLSTLTDPRGGRHSFTYDAGGLLRTDVDAGGDAKSLERTDLGPGSWQVTITDAGKATTYATETRPDGSHRFTVTDPEGARSTTLYDTDGSVTDTAPDGTTRKLVLAPDPRFGMQLPYVSSETVTTPGGRTRTAVATRTESFTDLNALTGRTDVVTVNGRATTQSYTAAPSGGGTISLTTPAGRHRSIGLDALGRPVSVTPAAGVTPITATYNADGQLASVTQGNRHETFAYDAQGRPTTTIDAAGDSVTRAYDAADRVSTLTSAPDGRQWSFTYDGNGNETGITLPGQAHYALAATADDQPLSVTPPGATAHYARTYTADRSLDTTTLPSGASTTQHYDAGGRLSSLTTSDSAAADFAYAGTTDRLSSATFQRGGSTQTVGLTYDGALPLTQAFTGAAAGTFTYADNNDLMAASMSIDAAAAHRSYAIGRDADLRTTSLGPWTIARSPQTGQPTKYSDGADGPATLTIGYDAFADATDRTLGSAYDLGISRDAAGRVSERRETVDGTLRTYDYAYDGAGNLLTVTEAGTTVEQYTYDGDGNRTSARYDGGPAQTATYDDNDRLVARDGVSYGYDAAGFMTARGADSFSYDARGDLVHATAGGHDIAYAYDAFGRLVHRADGAAATSFLYGNPSDPFQVTATTDQAGTLTAYFYDDDGLLFGLDRGGTRYLVATDQVGTPRLVAKLDGSVVRRFNHDAFGRATADSDPGAAQSDPSFSLPIGFAGGLEDPVTGLVRFGLRDYDAAAGRFAERDPSLFTGSPLGLYAYAGGDPVDNRDPSGLFCLNFSTYFGLGGGGSVCADSKGFSGCAELGVGLGESVDVDSLGTTSGTNEGWIGEYAFGYHGLGFTQTVEYNQWGYGCAPRNVTGKLGVGDYYFGEQLTPNATGGYTGASETPSLGRNLAGAPLPVGGKLARKSCTQVPW